MAGTESKRPIPTSISPAAPLTLAALALGSSWAIRGPRRSLRLLATSVTIAAGGEALAIRGTRILRHHSQPQIGDLPLAIPLMWYAYVAPCYALAQAAVGDRDARQVSAVTALLATATDIANDPWGLASGFWEWRDGGPYMRNVVGANGVAGIPIGNYLGWLLITASIAGLAERDRPREEVSKARRQRTILLLAYWVLGMGGLRWAATTHRWYLLTGGALTVVGGGIAAWYAARPKAAAS